MVTACGGVASPPTTTDLRILAAREYAASAERALDGTGFADLAPTEIGDVIIGLCDGTGSLLVDLETTVANLAAPPGEPGDDAILNEVLITGVTTVCPERTAADLAAAFLASYRSSAVGSGGVPLDDAVVLGVGLSVCDALDSGTPADGLVTVAAGAFGIEATSNDLLGGAMNSAQAVSAGALLASAATYLCPEHEERVRAFVGALVAEP